MARIIMLIVRGIFSLPSLYYQLLRTKDDPDADLDTRYRVARKFCAWIIKHGSIAPTVTGQENLPAEDGYLMVSNHQGLVDTVLICNSHPHFYTAVVKVELTKTFFVKDMITLLKAYPMDRDDLRQSARVIKQVSEGLTRHENCLIFPEGTRSRDGNHLGEFKPGALKCATRVKAPIVPVALVDCYKVFDEKGIKTVHPQVHYLEPIYAEEYEQYNNVELTELVKSRIEKKISEVVESRP